LLNPGDVITAILFATNTRFEHLTKEQTSQLRPTWSAHILNLKSITDQANPITEIREDPFKKFPFVVVLYGSALVVTLLGTIIFMVRYINLLYYLGYLESGRWQSVGAVIGVGLISLTSSEAITTYLFPNIYVFLAGGINNWVNIPWIVLNLVLLVWLSWKAWKARARPALPHT
jgi:hypothetical protein